MVLLFACVGQPTAPPADAGTSSDAGLVLVDAASTSCAPGAESTAAACQDRCSNDGDEYVDCEDRDCCDVVGCPSGTYCGDQPSSCPSGSEDTAARCSDGCSNDGDAFIDCDDRDCCAVVAGCGSDTFCGASAGGESTLAECSNGADDDGDDSSDCDDVSCCEVRSDCPSRTGCNPVGTATCNAGIGEAVFESGLVSFPVDTIHSDDSFQLEGGGVLFWWTPRRASSYSTSCSALSSSTAQIYECVGLSVAEQSWKDPTTGDCGIVRGRVWGTRPGGAAFSIDFVVPVRLEETQVAFAP